MYKIRNYLRYGGFFLTRPRFLAPDDTWNLISLESMALAATCAHILLKTSLLAVAVRTRCSQWREAILFSVQFRQEAHLVECFIIG